MILLFAVFVGLAATLVRARLTHRTLKFPLLRWEWLVIVSVVPQILAFQLPATARLIPESIVPVIQIASMCGLVAFVAINLRKPGFWMLGTGLSGNLAVMLANGGWMPISIDTLKLMTSSRSEEFWQAGNRLGFTKDRIMSAPDINLAWLSDRLLLPDWLPQNIAFSPGDVVIAIGTIILLWSLSRKEEQEKI